MIYIATCGKPLVVFRGTLRHKFLQISGAVPRTNTESRYRLHVHELVKEAATLATDIVPSFLRGSDSSRWRGRKRKGTPQMRTDRYNSAKFKLRIWF